MKVLSVATNVNTAIVIAARFEFMIPTEQLCDSFCSFPVKSDGNRQKDDQKICRICDLL